ncbi:MAG: ATP-binding protein, partial [Candidatus Promineifilaceae bacterium]
MSEYTEKQGPSVFELNAVQTAAEGAGGSAFLYGPAGTGKTTVLQRRLYRLLESGTQAYEILVLVSENQHISTFADVGGVRQLGPQSELKIVTYGAFAKEMIALLWPLIARPAGFTKVHSPPTFLGYDLAQLLMWKIIKSQLDAGMFTGLRLRPQQIVSQILDTLNRASLNGLDLEEAGRRQVDAWTGEPDHIRHLKDASSMAKLFRRHCLDNSLLDLSLI